MSRVEKGLLDFATEADVESEHAVLEVLRAQRPDDAVLGEETGLSGPPTAPRQWFIDPLCGTANFAAGTRTVAVNVALMAGRRNLAAAVADPFADELYWTDGSKAGVTIAGRQSDLKPDPATRLVELNFDTSIPSPTAFHTARLVIDASFLSRFRPRALSTSLALTWVAAGRRAAYVSDGDIREKEVHFAAGRAICEAAGCIVTDLRGRPWQDGGAGMIVAANAETHRALVAIVRPYLR